ncbi:MAG: thiamine pyrophosphate-binding protein [Acidobacteria bacterium]|nr:thiamine pyrophosphate-binding protein [Acidobacteriota bacterium]
MLDKYACLRKLFSLRRDEIVVTTMSVAAPWARLSDGPLDFAMVESSMGQAPAFGLGLALARPERRVIVLNGDGSTLMCLGTLVTMAQNPADNLILVIVENGTYEVTGNQPIPGAGLVDFETLARGAGLAHVHTIEDAGDFDACLPLHFKGPGPRVFTWKVRGAEEPVPKPRAYIRQRALELRQALGQ